MKLEDLTREQAEILDSIIAKSLTTNRVSIDDFPSVGTDRLFKDNPDIKRNYYQSLIDLLEKQNIVDIDETKDWLYIREKELETQNFIDKGGFKSLLVGNIEQKELKRLQDERKVLEFEKLKKEIVLITKNIEDYDSTKRRTKISLVIAIIGICISIGLAIKEFF